MANKLQIKRGLVATIPTGSAGEPLFTTDTNDLYIGTGSANIRFQKYIASGATTQILLGDGSLYSFPLAISSPSNGQVLKYNGTSWVNDSDAGLTGSGTTNEIAYFTGATTLGSLTTATYPSLTELSYVKGVTSAIQTQINNKFTLPSLTSGSVLFSNGTTIAQDNANLFWDDTNNRLGIGTNAPTSKVTVFAEGSEFAELSSTVFSSNALAAGSFLVRHARGTISSPTTLSTNDRLGAFVFSGYNGTAFVNPVAIAGYASENYTGSANGAYFSFELASTGATSRTERLRIFSNGNVLIQNGGTFTDSGQRLQVNGDTLLKGSGNTSGSTALTVQNSDGNNLFLTRNDGSIFFTTNAGTRIFPQIAGDGLISIGAVGLAFDGRSITGSVNTSQFFFYTSNTSTAGTQNFMRFSAGFTPTSGNAILNNTIINPTINQTGGANGITRGLYVQPILTAAADWRSIEWSNNSGWGLYGAGTANNYLAGSLGIGTTSFTGYGLRIGKSFTGTTAEVGVSVDGTIQTDVTSSFSGYISRPQISASAFTINALSYYQAREGTSFAGSSATITSQYGYYCFDLTKATNAYGYYGVVAARTGAWNLYMGGTALNYINSSLLIGSTTSSGEALQVTGTAKVTGATTFNGNVSLLLNQNAATRISITNTDLSSDTKSEFNAVSRNNGATKFGRYSILTTTYKILNASDGYVLNETLGDFAILNDVSTGKIKFAAGGSSTAQATLTAAGRLLLGTTTESTFLLDVNGTARVSGAMTLNVPSVAGTRETLLTGSISDSSTGRFFIANGTSNNSQFAPNFAGYVDTSGTLWSLGFAGLLSSGVDASDSSNFGILRFDALRTSSSSDPLNGALSAVVNRKLVTFENGSTAYMTFYKDVQVYGDAYNISFNTTTGTKIGTATSQKIALWNATPIVQPTTAIAEAAFVENSGGTAVNVDSTFAGYTLQQIAQALKDFGLLA